jgi:hypothetical protein
MKPPTETEHWPRLSTQLKGERHPFVCQSCGETSMIVTADTEPEDVGLIRWQEHDQQDKPQPIIVVLCKPCSDRLIEPHERLYHQLRKWAPALGAMRFCSDCSFRDGLHCSHRDSKENGGAGLIVKFPKPSHGFVDSRGGGYSGPMIFWAGPVKSCAGYERGKGVDEFTRLGECRSCHAAIVWMKTENDKTIPVDLASFQKGDKLYDSKRHVSHFATCSDAARWSHKNASKKKKTSCPNPTQPAEKS